MENTATIAAPQVGDVSKKTSLIKALGPGVMMASAAVGGSHLVSSTQAGAIYGWQLAALILLVNFFKYPFLELAFNIR